MQCKVAFTPLMFLSVRAGKQHETPLFSITFNISKRERHALYNDVLCNCSIKDGEVWDKSRKVFSLLCLGICHGEEDIA